MPSRSSRRRGMKLAAGLVSIVLALFAFSGLVAASSPKPASITVAVNGKTATASGSWTWNSQANPSASRLNLTGFAVDWGDFNGNAVGTYHVGTASDNTVHQTSTAGASGNWGPIQHTYAADGKYTVCVIMYNIGAQGATSFPPSGLDSLIAGGPNRNTNNSVEGNGNSPNPAVQCMDIVIGAAATGSVVPTATPTQAPSGSANPSASMEPSAVPSQTVAGVTSRPVATPPSTSTDSSNSSGGSSPMPLILLGISGALGVFALKPVRSSRH